MVFSGSEFSSCQCNMNNILLFENGQNHRDMVNMVGIIWGCRLIDMICALHEENWQKRTKIKNFKQCRPLLGSCNWIEFELNILFLFWCEVCFVKRLLTSSVCFRLLSEILKETSEDIEEIEYLTDGSWRPIRDDKERDRERERSNTPEYPVVDICECQSLSI